MSSAQQGLLVLGIGNPSCGDDAAGPAVVEKINQSNASGVFAEAIHAEPAAIITSMKGRKKVVLVDSIRSNGATGTLHIFDVSKSPLPADLFSHFSTHSFGLVDAIELARALGELPPVLFVLGIEGENFETGDSMNPRVSKAIDDATEWILEHVRSHAFTTNR